MKFSFHLSGVVCAAFAIAEAGSYVSAQGWGPPSGDRRGGYDSGYEQQGNGLRPPSEPPGGYRSPSFYTNPRCRDLEQQLTGGSAGIQDQLPRIEADLRQADVAFHKAEADADRADCYEDMFLFGRSLKRTPRCVDLDRQVQSAKSRLSQLKAQQDGLTRGGSRRRRDDLVAELARNNCGDNYAREYERQKNRSSSLFSFFSDEESDDTGRSNAFKTAPASTFQTKCVRLCDGYYFPISYSVAENVLPEDQAKCQSQCAAPAELYYHRVDQDVEQMVSLQGRPYSTMPNAFRNRKVFLRGCSCNANEYSVAEIAKSEDALKQSNGKRADAGSKTLTDAAPAIAPKPTAPDTQPSSASGGSGTTFRPTLSNPGVLKPSPAQ